MTQNIMGNRLGRLRPDLWHTCSKCALALKSGTTCPICNFNLKHNGIPPEYFTLINGILYRAKFHVVIDAVYRVIDNAEDLRWKSLKPKNVCNICGKLKIAKYKIYTDHTALCCESCYTKHKNSLFNNAKIIEIEDGEYDMGE